MKSETNFIDGLRTYYIELIAKASCDCIKVIISKTEIQYILDIISIFKFQSQPYELGSELLCLDIYVK